MNQQQRRFLIERIQTKTKEKIKALEEQKLKYPSGSNYLFKAILDGTLKLQPESHILKVLEDRAMKAVEGESWLSKQSNGWGKHTHVNFDSYEDIFIMPEGFQKEKERVATHNAKLKAQIEELQVTLDTIEVRIQLASDKTLQSMVNEVDDMGDIKLIDTKVKRLN